MVGSMRLQDQIILITGSTTGIGEHMARRFVAEGAKVILHGRDAERGQALREELGADRSAFCQGDLADAAYPEKLAAEALGAFGRIDALVNNAALTTRNKIGQTDAAFFDRIMAANARAPMLLIRRPFAGPGSIQGLRPQHRLGPRLSRTGQPARLLDVEGALMTMTRNLGDSLGHRGVRVNQLNVG